MAALSLSVIPLYVLLQRFCTVLQVCVWSQTFKDSTFKHSNHIQVCVWSQTKDSTFSNTTISLPFFAYILLSEIFFVAERLSVSLASSPALPSSCGKHGCAERLRNESWCNSSRLITETLEPQIFSRILSANYVWRSPNSGQAFSNAHWSAFFCLYKNIPERRTYYVLFSEIFSSDCRFSLRRFRLDLILRSLLHRRQIANFSGEVLLHSQQLRT